MRPPFIFRGVSAFFTIITHGSVVRLPGSKMRVVLLRLAALALPAAEPAYAADLLRLRSAPPKPGVPESHGFNWTGTYASGYLGVEALKGSATELGSHSRANAAHCASAAQFAAVNAANGLPAPTDRT